MGLLLGNAFNITTSKAIQLQYNSKTKNSVYTSTNELLSSVRHATLNNTTTIAVVRQSFGRTVLPNVRWLSHRTNSSNYWQWIRQLIHSVTIVRPAIPSELKMTTKVLLQSLCRVDDEFGCRLVQTNSSECCSPCLPSASNWFGFGNSSIELSSLPLNTLLS